MGLRLLVVDAPNITGTLTNLLDRFPKKEERPDFSAIFEWFMEGHNDDEGDTSEACVFVNVPSDKKARDRLVGWVSYLKKIGYLVFGRPKSNGEDDIDEAMLRHLQKRLDEGDLTKVVVLSGDARCFVDPLVKLAKKGVRVEVVAFVESAGSLTNQRQLQFVDIEKIPGALPQPLLQRTNLERLAEEGEWL